MSAVENCKARNFLGVRAVVSVKKKLLLIRNYDLQFVMTHKHTHTHTQTHTHTHTHKHTHTHTNTHW